MPLDNLSDLSALILAISLATERLVVIVKTVFPQLGEERPPAPGETADEADRMRRLSVLGVAYLCALVTAWLIADGWTIEYGAGRRVISIFGVALLASGGSAFWTQVVGFASAAKDVRKMERQRMHDEVAPQPVIVVASTGGAPTHIAPLPPIPR
jgi:hypothetical protein